MDDGIATGATALAACEVARAQGAARVVLAVPVAAPDAAERVRGQVDELVCLSTPLRFSAVGEWYRDFGQTPDEEVVALLARAADWLRADARRGGGGGGRRRAAGELTAAGSARALVVFAHGSGSSRHSPRNRAVAAALHRAGFGTLLFDLLTPAEEADRANVFDIETLAGRLVNATGRLLRRESLPVGVFGASTGAAAALRAAAPWERSRARGSARSSPGEAGPIWRAPASVTSGLRRCWSWAAATAGYWS